MEPLLVSILTLLMGGLFFLAVFAVIIDAKLKGIANALERLESKYGTSDEQPSPSAKAR